MTSFVAPGMVWNSCFRKLISRSLIFAIFFTCIVTVVTFVVFAVNVISNPSGSGVGNDDAASKTSHFIISRVFAHFYNEQQSSIRSTSFINFQSFTNRRHKTLLLIAVVSSVNNSDRRNAIRATWGHPLTQIAENVVVRFLIGQPNDPAILYNKSRFDDEVFLPINDDYFRLASKSKLVLEWLANNPDVPPSDYRMKVDDDSFLNLPALANYFRDVKAQELLPVQNNKNNDNKPSFYCYLHVNVTPIRDNVSRWYVDESVYSQPIYPPYCSGSAYVFPSDAAKQLYLEVASILSEKPHNQKGLHEMPEDVLVTGLAAMRLNMSHSNMSPLFESFFKPTIILPIQQSSSQLMHNGIQMPDGSDSTGPTRSTILEWLCRRAAEGAIALHPVRSPIVPTSTLMGALLVASLMGSYQDCTNLALASAGTGHVFDDDPLGDILTIREASA